MADAANRRFPDGVEPYQMGTRLLEECGEVAAEICHWEGSGVKRIKRGEPSKEAEASADVSVLLNARCHNCPLSPGSH